MENLNQSQLDAIKLATSKLYFAGQDALQTFTFHSDAGHGWLAVPEYWLIDLGINNKISRYSYSNNTTVYLEEDCDALLFDKAYKLRYGTYSVREINNDGDSPIRNYRRYSEAQTVQNLVTIGYLLSIIAVNMPIFYTVEVLPGMLW